MPVEQRATDVSRTIGVPDSIRAARAAIGMPIVDVEARHLIKPS
jgi:hypothetical protein